MLRRGATSQCPNSGMATGTQCTGPSILSSAMPLNVAALFHVIFFSASELFHLSKTSLQVSEGKSLERSLDHPTLDPENWVLPQDCCTKSPCNFNTEMFVLKVGNPCPTLGQLLASRILYALVVGEKQHEIARARFRTQSCSKVGQILVSCSQTPHPGMQRSLPACWDTKDAQPDFMRWQVSFNQNPARECKLPRLAFTMHSIASCSLNCYASKPDLALLMTATAQEDCEYRLRLRCLMAPSTTSLPHSSRA